VAYLLAAIWKCLRWNSDARLLHALAAPAPDYLGTYKWHYF